MSQRFHYHLAAPVILVTKGRGREVFRDSKELFARLAELPRLRESILSIQHGRYALSEEGIAALETMIWLVGFTLFKRAGERAGAPFNRFATRWSWRHLGEYLGWDWRPL